MNLAELIKSESVTIVDVREPLEFFLGHAKGTKNIPLRNVSTRVEEFKNMSKPLILVCATGNRSGQAAAFLKAQGITEVYNGGGWKDVKNLVIA